MDFDKTVSELRHDVNNVKDDVSELKQDVSNLKDDVTELRVDMAHIKGTMPHLATHADISRMLMWLVGVTATSIISIAFGFLNYIK